MVRGLGVVMFRATVLASLLFAAQVGAEELYPVHDAAGRMLGAVSIESSNLDRVGVAPAERAALVVVEHGRHGGASLLVVDSSGSRELVRTGSDESLSLPAWSVDGSRFAFARTSAPSWVTGQGTPILQQHGVLVVGDGTGALQTLDLGGDVARVLGWTATALVFTRARLGDLPEERPYALDLRTRAVLPLLDEAAHVYNLTLLDGRLYFARTSVEVLTAPGPEQRVELVQQELVTGAQQVLAIEIGALPAALRLSGRRLAWALDATLQERVLDLDSRVLETRELGAGDAPLQPAPSPGGDLAMPYVHQVYDTPDDFNGNWACGPTSALMCVLHYGRLGKWPVHASTPSAHTSDYGAYVAYEYSAFGSTFNRVQNDASGRAAKGGYGWCTDGGGAWAWRMQDYAKRHDLKSDFDGTATFAKIQAAIDAGKTVSLSTQLTSAGHIIAVKGYTSDGKLVTNDPYGNKNLGYKNYKGEGAVYTWAQVGAKWFITIYGTVTPTNKPPTGWLDGADCSRIWGWSQDPDEPTKSIAVHVYPGGPAGSSAPGKALTADGSRSDLCAAIGSCNHAFELASPYSLHDGKPHPVHAYGIDSQGGANAELAGSPKTLTCPAEPPAGSKRHVTNPTVLAAWKFDLFYDQLTIADAKLDAMPVELAIPESPVLVRADGRPEVWLLDQGHRRHVPNPAIAASWRLALDSVQVKPAAEVDAYPVAPALRARPVLVKGSGPAVYLVDDALPKADAGTPGPDAARPGADAARPAADASRRIDAGAEAEDGGAEADAGPRGDGGAQAGPANGVDEVEGGCGCGAGANGLGPLAVLGSLFALRRRRR